MPIDPTHWSVTPNGTDHDIRYIGPAHGAAGATYATVLELHRWLQDLADDPSPTGDDLVSIVDSDPSNKSTKNIVTLKGGYNIDDASAEHLFDGSIIQKNGDEIYDGIKNFGNSGVNIQIIQNGAKIANDFWNNNGGLNANASQHVSHNFMLKVRTGGADIDGRRLTGFSRELGRTYKEFSINGTERGINVLAIETATDLNNQTAEATLAAIADITNAEGYQLIDVNNDGTGEPYYSQWDRGANSINTLYEYAKWLTRHDSGSTLYGLPGYLFRGVTHEIPLSGGAGTWVEPEAVSWPGGTGQLLAVDDTAATAATKMWIQLLTGTAPSNGDTITGAGGATATAGAAVSRSVSSPFIGASTGSALIGAYGVGVKTTGLTANDKLTDLDDNLNTPPNFVTFEVKGLVVGEDRVLVGPWDGATLDADGKPVIDTDQLTVATALTGAAETAVQVTAPIPADTPASGTLRLKNDNGWYSLVDYTSWAGDTFTIPATDFTTNQVSANANGFISYIDRLAAGSVEAFQTIYNANRDLVVRVRDGGSTPIVPFITSAELTNSGGAVTVIRNPD